MLCYDCVNYVMLSINYSLNPHPETPFGQNIPDSFSWILISIFNLNYEFNLGHAIPWTMNTLIKALSAIFRMNPFLAHPEYFR